MAWCCKAKPLTGRLAASDWEDAFARTLPLLASGGSDGSNEGWLLGVKDRAKFSILGRRDEETTGLDWDGEGESGDVGGTSGSVRIICRS